MPNYLAQNLSGTTHEYVWLVYVNYTDVSPTQHYCLAVFRDEIPAYQDARRREEMCKEMPDTTFTVERRILH